MNSSNHSPASATTVVFFSLKSNPLLCLLHIIIVQNYDVASAFCKSLMAVLKCLVNETFSTKYVFALCPRQLLHVEQYGLLVSVGCTLLEHRQALLHSRR